MTIARGMADDEGAFGDWILIDRPCPQCHERTIRYRVWESHDGAYEDLQFKCFALTCSHTWWVEGPDS